MSHGIDVSNNNTPPVDHTGVQFVIAKATESTGFVDKTLNDWREAAQSINALFSTYHFAHPDVNSAQAEATYYLAHSPKGDFGPCLDFESRDWKGVHYDPIQILGVSGCVDWANEFLDRVAQVRQQHPFFYSFRSYMRPMIAGGLDGWYLWLSSMVGRPMFPTFAGRDIAIEQWGIVGGVDQNESYINLKPADAPPMPSPINRRQDMFTYIIKLPSGEERWYMVASGKHLYLDDVARVGVMSGGIPHLGKMTPHFQESVIAAWGPPVGSP